MAVGRSNCGRKLPSITSLQKEGQLERNPILVVPIVAQNLLSKKKPRPVSGQLNSVDVMCGVNDAIFPVHLFKQPWIKTMNAFYYS